MCSQFNRRWRKIHCFQHIMLYYFRIGKNAMGTQEKSSAVYGEGAVTNQTYQKWFAKFHAEDLSLVVAPWSGRPVKVDNNQIETLIENNQHYIMQEQENANIFKISKSIKLLMKIKNVFYFSEKNHTDCLANPMLQGLAQIMPFMTF